MRTWDNLFWHIGRLQYDPWGSNRTPATAEAAQRAESLARMAQKAGWPLPSWAVANEDQSITLAWCSEGNGFYLEAEGDGSFSSSAYQDGKLVVRDEPWPAGASDML